MDRTEGFWFWCSFKSRQLSIWNPVFPLSVGNFRPGTKRAETFYTEMTLCGLLANINISAATTGRAAICICHGWAFVWQERLCNRSCWQHVGADLRRPGSQRETTGGSPQTHAPTFSGLGGSLPCLFAVLAFTVCMDDHGGFAPHTHYSCRKM